MTKRTEKRKLSELDKRCIEGNIESIRSIAESMMVLYPKVSKDDKELRNMVGTWTAAVRQVSAEIDKAIGI